MYSYILSFIYINTSSSCVTKGNKRYLNRKGNKKRDMAVDMKMNLRKQGDWKFVR